MVMRDSTLLISDLHLDPQRPQVLDWLIDFLDGPAREANALYLLGDLFEAWIGDDAPAPGADAVAMALRRLSERGIAIAFQAGNRDFLLGQDYARSCGMRLMAEAECIDIGGVRTLLVHGDTLCTDDVDYQAFRAQVRDPAWQAGFLARPASERWVMAAQARGESRSQTRNKPESIMDVNAAAVIEAMRRHGVRRLVHGHTHRPGLHQFELDGTPAQRLVLGDWDRAPSVLAIARDGSGWLSWADRRLRFDAPV